MKAEKRLIEHGFTKVALDEFLAKKIDKAGYGKMKVERTPGGTQITLFAEKPGMLIGKGGKNINKLTEDLNDGFDLDNPQVEVNEIESPQTNARIVASRLASVLERGTHFRRASYRMLSDVMDAGALGCEIVISGKLTGQRARKEKFVDGIMKHTGKIAEDMVGEGFATAKTKPGTIGVKVRIIPPGTSIPDELE